MELSPVAHDEDTGTSGTSDSEATVRQNGSPRNPAFGSLDTDHGDEDDIIVFAGEDMGQLLKKPGSSRRGSVPASPVVGRLHIENGVVVSADWNREILAEYNRTWKSVACDSFFGIGDLAKEVFLTMRTVDWRLISQATPSLLLATAGLIFAGWLLDIVQHWPVFERVTELFILVPIVLNLKGNLEMNLASRLATAANSGLLSNMESAKGVISGNMLLLQVQAIVVGLMAGLEALFLGSVFHPEFNTWTEDFLLINTSILTAAVTSLLLGTLMCGLVIGCKYLNLDPDNIATPIAATLGDLVTLWILAGISHISLVAIDTPVTPVVLLTVLLSLPLWWMLAYRNDHVNAVLKRGWTPIIVSMAISSVAGLLMEEYIRRFEGLAIIIPVLNGESASEASP